MSVETWKEVKLGDICKKIGSGATPKGGKEAYLEKGEFALIRSQNVLDFSHSYDGLAYINKEQASRLNNVSLEQDDVLLNITGDSVARVCQVPNEILPARVNQHVDIIRPDKEKLDQKFLKYYLLNPQFKSFMLGLSSVGGTRNALTKLMIEDFHLNLPELDTQKRIASILTSLDEKIELNHQTAQTLEAIAQAIFKEWFVDFNFPGTTGEMQESELGEIPKGWRVGKLREIVELNPKLSIKKGNTAKYVEMKDLSETSLSINRFIEREFTSGSKFQNGDTLFARITPCLENGKTGLVDFLNESETGWGSTEFIVLRGKTISSFFVYCLSRFERFREFAIQSMVGSSGRQRVVESILSDYTIVIPPKEIISTFHEKAESLFKVIKTNHEQTKTLTQLRDSLLPKLMKGEISIN
jgi:type I restriction enzyme, S subunit